MRLSVLGPIELRQGTDQAAVGLGGPKQRALLGLLVAANGRLVSTGQLIDELWGDDPPAKVLASIQSYVAKLRQLLDPGRTARSGSGRLIGRSPGYLLDLRADPRPQVDVTEFEELLRRARPAMRDDPRTAHDLLVDAERLWRGDAYADCAAMAPSLAAESTRLGELRLRSQEDRLRCALALGQHDRASAELRAAVAAQPTRESLWGLLALALYRSERQSEALEALVRARRVLVEEVGIDPGPELRRLETAMLRQDPALDLPAAQLAGTATTPGPVPGAPVRDSDGRRPTPPRTTLVGRTSEHDRITAEFEAARHGSGRVVLISGEPGIGKTELSRRVLAEAAAAGFGTGWGTCPDSTALPGLRPISVMLGDLLTELPADRSRAVRDRYAERLGPAAPDASPPPIGAAPDRTTTDVDSVLFRISTALSELIGEIGPALLVLDDLHWASPATLALLRVWLPDLGRLPALLIITLRTEEHERPDLLTALLADVARTGPVRIKLGGLDTDAVGAFVRQQAPALADTETVSFLALRSGGNPFFLSELVGLADGRLLPDHVPDGVRDVVRRRLDRLPDGVAGYLRTAAVIGASFDPELAGDVSGLAVAAALDAAATAESAGLLTAADGDLAFSHALVRDAVLAELSESDRRRLHARIATQLVATGVDRQLAEAAFHFARAGRSYSGRAIDLAVRAAEQARRAGQHDLAARLCELANDVSDREQDADVGRRRHVLTALAASRKQTGQNRRAWEAGLAAARLGLQLGDPVGAAEAVIAVSGDALWTSREYPTVDEAAIAIIEHLTAGVRAGQPRLSALLDAAWAAEVYYDPRLVLQAVASSDRALATIRGHGSAEDVSQVLQLRHVALDRPDLLAERLETAQELVRSAELRAEETTLAAALVFRGRDRIESGAVEAGWADYERARAIATRLTYVPVLVALAWWDVSVLINVHRFDRARLAFRSAVDLHGRTTLPGSAAVPQFVRVVLGLEERQARGWLDETGIAVQGTPLGLLRDAYALGLMQAGRDDEALPLVARSLGDDALPDYLWLTHQALRAELWIRAGRYDALRTLADTLRPYAGRVIIGGTGISLLGAVDTVLGSIHEALGNRALAEDHRRSGAETDARLRRLSQP